METGASNGFNVEVNPAALAQFVFTTQPVGPYLAGDGIVVRIEAQDSVGNLITGFNGSATISDLTGTVNEGVAESAGAGGHGDAVRERGVQRRAGADAVCDGSAGSGTF